MSPIPYLFTLCNLVIGAGAFVISRSLIGHLDLSQLSWVGGPFGLLALLTLAFEPAQPGLWLPYLPGCDGCAGLNVALLRRRAGWW